MIPHDIKNNIQCSEGKNRVLEDESGVLCWMNERERDVPCSISSWGTLGERRELRLSRGSQTLTLAIAIAGAHSHCRSQRQQELLLHEACSRPTH